MTERVALSQRELRRVQQHDLSRGQLLDAAEEVFGRRGYHDATLKDVAELAEFSVGSVYSFFENKDDLFLQVFLRRGDAFLAGLGDAVATQDPPTARLRRLVDFEVSFFRDHPHFGRLYLRTASVGWPVPGSVVDAPFTAGLDHAMALHAAVLRDGQADGTFRPGDPLVLARILSGIVLSYLAVDPAVIGDGDERLSLHDLHSFVSDAFRP